MSRHTVNLALIRYRRVKSVMRTVYRGVHDPRTFIDDAVKPSLSRELLGRIVEGFDNRIRWHVEKFGDDILVHGDLDLVIMTTEEFKQVLKEARDE